MEIKIKYFSEDVKRLQKIDKGDWIDLSSADDIEIHPGDFKLIPLGVAMMLPCGYEAHIAPRSSAFKNWGIIQTNSVGIVDESYCGPDDQWFMPVYATRHAIIDKGDRICQFRVVEKMPDVVFAKVNELKNPDRGGHGSTGK